MSLILQRYTYEASKYRINTCMASEEYTRAVHWHSQFELIFLVSGRGTQIINNKRYPMKAGSIFLLSPADFHGYTIFPEDTQWKFIMANFSYNIFHDRLRALIDFKKMPLCYDMIDDDKAFIQTELERFSSELERQEYGYDMIVRSRIEAVVITLLRRLTLGTQTQERDSSDLRLQDAIFYIHSKFRDNVSLENAAKTAYMSPSHFSRSFTIFTGENFISYVRRLRLEFAKNLLENSAASVTDACFESGFNSLSYFSKSFKQMFGKSPEHFRSADAKE